MEQLLSSVVTGVATQLSFTETRVHGARIGGVISGSESGSGVWRVRITHGHAYNMYMYMDMDMYAETSEL